MSLRILIISHVPWDSTYGAGTSLRLHVKSLESEVICNKVELSLISPTPIRSLLKRGRIWDRPKTPLFRTHLNLQLPTSKNYEGCGSKKKNLKGYFTQIIHGALCIIGSLRLKILLQNDYDLVHLNSVTLAPTAHLLKKRSQDRKLRIVMHVREFLQESLTKKDREYLTSVDHFVCIDLATEKRLLSVLGTEYSQRSQVINNPFVISARRDFAKLLEADNSSTIKFCMIGTLSELKGVMLIAKAFSGIETENCILFFVGDGGDRPFLEAFANQQPHQIKVLGKLDNVSERGIYNDIDVVLRGDPSFRIGRTVFEALYAGCIVVMPGTTGDLDEDEHLYPFHHQIVLYDPGSISSCTNALTRAALLVRANNLRPKLMKDNLESYRYSMLNIYCKQRLGAESRIK